jgi:hypothetical protein
MSRFGMQAKSCQRTNFAGHSAKLPARIGDHQPAGFADRREHRLLIEESNGA